MEKDSANVKYLTEEEIIGLIKRIKEYDNEAWKQLYKNYERYIYKRVWIRLKKIDMTIEQKQQLVDDLFMSGWEGFIYSLKNFNPQKAKFLTYATNYIDGEISKELNQLFNPLGLTERPKPVKGKEKSHKISRVSWDACLESVSTFAKDDKGLNVAEAPEREKYSAERRVLQILEVLRILTDEKNSISKEELGKMLSLYRSAKYNNGIPLEAPNTFTSTLENMLQELNPMEYSNENENLYKIKYEGYKEDRLKKKISKECGRKASDITKFSYVHVFDNAELDKLIQLVCFSDMLSVDEKSQLINKLIGTASSYYKTPFWDDKKIKFNPRAIHGRFSGRKQADNIQFAENLKIIQQAVNNLVSIKFSFNRVTAQHEMEPITEYFHILSPYHLVVYHDKYYCIGLKKDNHKIWHYRVDLMSDIEIVRDEEGKMVPIEVSSFEGLPIFNAYWNPGKYMAEHLNMAWDEPRNIRIKIKNTGYTMIHDWFGEHYEKTNESEEEGYDVVIVKTSPTMIVHWSMQYGMAVEILDKEIRKKIREEIAGMAEKYAI